MTLVPVGQSDITVESTADGYSESLTVENGDTVNVDTHATASASASPSVVLLEYGPFSMDLSGGASGTSLDQWRLKIDEIKGYRGADGETQSFNWIPQGHNITVEISAQNSTGYDMDVSFKDSVVVGGDGDGEYTTPFTTMTEVKEFEMLEFNSNLDNPDSGGATDVTLRIKKDVSAVVDSKSVVTDDIHR